MDLNPTIHHDHHVNLSKVELDLYKQNQFHMVLHRKKE